MRAFLGYIVVAMWFAFLAILTKDHAVLIVDLIVACLFSLLAGFFLGSDNKWFRH